MRKWWGPSLVVAWLLGSAALASAESINYGSFCWKLSPFGDRIELEAVQLDPAEGTFALYGTQRYQIPPDPPLYVLNGGGMAVQSLDRTKLSISMPMHNTFQAGFGGHPVCRFTAVIEAGTLTGPGFEDCLGSTVPGKTQTAFVVPFTLQPETCNVPASVQMQRHGEGGRPAGEYTER